MSPLLMTICMLEMLHPILQEVRRRGIITAIRTQPELVRVRDTQGVTGAHATAADLRALGDKCESM